MLLPQGFGAGGGLGNSEATGGWDARPDFVVEVSQGLAGGSVRCVLVAEFLDFNFVCFEEGNEEVPVFLEDISHSLFGVSSERLQLSGVILLNRFDDTGE